MARRERFTLASSDDVLGELYGTPAPSSGHSEDTSSPPSESPDDTSSPRGETVSNTPSTRGQRPSETGASAASSTRTPEGMCRHTMYIPKSVADQFDAVAEQLVKQVRGMVPKHVVLSELVAVSIAGADEVARRLRARLIAQLEDDGK